MGRINVLDKHVAELIAAGEVVERPASVIKELVENAIDAGSKSITVEIMHGGVSYIRVSDDGCGIMREDIRNAFVRHATSKVLNADDLNSIATLGFRGEALASVSSVAKVELFTRSDNEDEGSRFVINGGEEVEFDTAGCPKGTTIIVRDIFYNVPARMKFLKKDVSEGNAVTAVIDKMSLSHPEIAFTYIRDGKQVLKTTGDGKLIASIYAVYGRDFAKTLVPVEYSLNGIRVKGYVSQPHHSRANRSMQNFFINDRFVHCRTAMVALEEACKGMVMVGRFPACVLFIYLSFEGVDVNVHPAKTEIRFLNERPVFDAVYHGVKSALLANHREKEAILPQTKTVGADIKNNPVVVEKLSADLSAASVNKGAQAIFSGRPQDEPIISLPKKSMPFSSKRLSDRAGDKSAIGAYFDLLDQKEFEGVKKGRADNGKSKNENIDAESDNPGSRVEDNSVDSNNKNAQDTADALDNIKKEEAFDTASGAANKDNSIGEISKPSLNYIGEVFNTYILAQRGEKELLVIDKHAAHERIIYERLKEENGSGYSQVLISPITVLLSVSEHDAVMDNLEAFSKLGFDIDDFGNSTVAVRAYPQYLHIDDIELTVQEMAGHLLENRHQIESERMDWVYHNVACRAAIKGGNINSAEELEEILRIVESDKKIRYCPHGRPVSVVIKKGEFEKMFGRV